ncbi:MAG TPA: PqqD family protein [Bryobacteraceae bacterium]|jgi:hypothetical protein|nr:PqqD family protein [Bryobacteraceae bacterium]
MTGLTVESKVKISEDVLFQELQGDAVLLDLKSGVYFGLDQVGTRIWQLMGERQPLSAVIGAVVGEFDVTEERCAEDVLTLAGKLADNGLLITE